MSDKKDWLNDPYISNPQDCIALAAIEWLLPILYNARHRPQMYFQPIGPDAFTHWMSGLETGLRFGGVWERPDHRNAALDRRGLEHKATGNVEDLEGRGLTPGEIVYELLSIEIEGWEEHREEILKSAR